MANNCLTFSQGQTAYLTAQFVTTEGMAIDVPDATVEVFGAGNYVALAATTMTNLTTGFYAYDWVIPNSLPVGNYTVRYTGTVLGIASAATDSITVLAAGTPTNYSQSSVAAAAALETYLCCAQNLPVYREVGRRNADRDTFQFSWPRWNLSNHIIKLNNQILQPTEYTVNTDTGTVVFPAPLHPTDVVMATYNFRYFSTQDLMRFLTDALSQINLEAPGTTYTLDNVPDAYIGVLMMGATKNAIKKLLFCLTFQETQTLFGGPDRAKDAISNLTALKENNEKEFTADKKQLKRMRYPCTVAVVTPEYTLPGGRARWFRYLFSGGVG